MTTINTEKGELRIWESGGKFKWATPNDSEGSDNSFDEAVEAAFEAEELKPEEYGY